MWGWLFGIVCVICFTVIICKGMTEHKCANDDPVKSVQNPPEEWSNLGVHPQEPGLN